MSRWMLMLMLGVIVYFLKGIDHRFQNMETVMHDLRITVATTVSNQVSIKGEVNRLRDKFNK